MSETRGATDKLHTVKLEGRIERVEWVESRAAAGAEAQAHIVTRFVGNGAPVSVDVKTEKGKKVGSIDGEIWFGEMTETFAVPANASDNLVLDVNLKKHGLKAKSERPLIVEPACTIEKPRWDREVARRGEVVELAADVRGIVDGTRVPITIFEHDDDGGHDLITQITGEAKGGKLTAKWEYEYFEDTDEIPAGDEADKGYQPPEYFFRVAFGGVSADSGLLGFKDWVDIALTLGGNAPAKGEEYVLTLPDGAERKGTLDDAGKAVEKDVPPGTFSVAFPRLAGHGASGGATGAA